MGALDLSGNIAAGPASGGAVFPGSAITIPLGTLSKPKGYQRATGIIERTLALAVFTDLGEPGNVVTQGDFLYFRSDASIELRLTTDDGVGGNVVSIVPVHGICIIEFPTAKHLKLLEANGSGKVEYFLSGQS